MPHSYDTATIAGFQAMPGFLKVYGYEDKKSKIGWNIATTPQQLISSFLNLGTIIGVVLTHLWAKRHGRRGAIWAASFTSFVAAGLQIGTEELVGLYFGRILIVCANQYDPLGLRRGYDTDRSCVGHFQWLLHNFCQRLHSRSVPRSSPRPYRLVLWRLD
jgi:hypothetical protein